MLLFWSAQLPVAVTALVHTAALLQNIHRNTFHPQLLRSLTLKVRMALLRVKKTMVSKVIRVTQDHRIDHGEMGQGKILQVPRMKPNFLEHARGFKAFYCWLLKLTFF